MPRARSILPFMATRIAVECSAALPTIATTTTPMNTLPRPMAVPASSTAWTRNSLTTPTRTAAASSTPRLLPTDQGLPSSASAAADATELRLTPITLTFQVWQEGTDPKAGVPGRRP